MPLKLKRVSSPPVSVSGNSVLFNGSSQYLSIPSNAAFNLGTGSFTVECWFYATANVSSQQCLITNYGGSSAGWAIQIIDGLIAANLYGDGRAIGGGSPVINTWYHAALSGAQGSIKLFLNGVQVGSTYTGAVSMNTSAAVTIGNIVNTAHMAGYISNARVVKGTALYTSNFTPPTAPLTAIANTSLLTCNAATIIDSSSNNFTITNNGTATVSSAVTPFTSTSYASTFKFKNVNNIPTTQKAIFGYGSTNGAVNGVISTTNKVSNTGVVSTDTTGVGTGRMYLAASGYGGDKAIFGYGQTTSVDVSITNLVSNTGVVANDTIGVGTSRHGPAAAGYGTDKAIFGYGYVTGPVSMTNLVSNTGVVATDTTGVGTARSSPAAARYGTDKAIFGYGYLSSITNLVSNTGIVASDTTGVGTARYGLAAAAYGTDKAIFGYGYTSTPVSITNLVSNTGVVATDTSGVGTARYEPAASGYGGDKAIFGYGDNGVSTTYSMTNLVSNTGVVATDTTGVGTSRSGLAAASYSNTGPSPSGGSFKKVYADPAVPDFTISPAYSGKSSWNLTVDGPLVLSGSGTWTITPVSNFNTTVKMWGAGGARGFDYNSPITSTMSQGPGGAGGYSTANIAIQTGNSYIIQVGQGGIRTYTASSGATYLAGGLQSTRGGPEGGGYSGIFITSVSQANALLMAGGGGGGGAENVYYGGAGGGDSGANAAYNSSVQSGGGGTQSNGGYASISNGATAGSALTGGLASSANHASLGGGGGGYWGGGGGNIGGGGGGSGRIGTHASVTSGTTTAGANDVPGNNSDADRGGAGRGGNATSNSGADGKIIITKI